MKKRILLIAGRVKTKSLAISLRKQGYHVTIINNNYADCMSLAKLEGVNVIYGDGTKSFILDEAGAADCSFSIALSSCDADNLVASQLCKQVFHVKKTVCLLSDPRKTEFFYHMGVDSVVCATQTITNIIEQQTFIDDMTNIIPIAQSNVQIIEVRIPNDSPIVEKKLWEISLPTEVIVGCVLRGDSTVIPRGDTRILAGDTLVVLAASGQEQQAVKELTGR